MALDDKGQIYILNRTNEGEGGWIDVYTISGKLVKNKLISGLNQNPISIAIDNLRGFLYITNNI
jgi:hypothetical protein